MSQQSIEKSIVINRPIEEVFDTATCLRSCVNWQASVVQAEKVSDGPTGVGTQFKHTGKFLGISFESNPVVTRYEPSRVFGYSNGGSPQFDVLFSFEPVGEGTRFTAKVSSNNPDTVFRQIALPLVVAAMGRGIETAMHNLKDLMEANVAVKLP
jgi:uncharacterized protein YndB with AHSA1/START domain